MWPTIIRLACVCLQHGRPDLGHEPPCSPGSSQTGYFGRLTCFPLVCFYHKWERAKKRPGTYKQLRPQDLRAKHGSTLDTITNPFVGPPHLPASPCPNDPGLQPPHPPPSSLRHRLVGTRATLNALWEVGRARAADGCRVWPKSTFKPGGG